jgi:hypothetical protein
MRLLSLDISGNFKEGKGTSGICIMDDGKIRSLSELKASDYDSAERYWNAHRKLLEQMKPDYLVFEGFRLYETKAKTQIHSEFETPQLIGCLKMFCFDLNIPYLVQFAGEVKKRWHEDILVKKGILELKNGRYLWNGKATNGHMRDALKHVLHFSRYKI